MTASPSSAAPSAGDDTARLSTDSPLAEYRSPAQPVPDEHASRPPGTTPWWDSLTRALMAAAVVIVVMLAFLWPTLSSTPRGLTLDVVGADARSMTSQALDAVESKLDSRPFDLHDTADRADAERRIRERESYGAVVVGSDGAVTVLTASAANATAAQMLQQLAAQERAGLAQKAAEAGKAREAAQPAATPSLTVTDLVPNPETDPNGTAFALAGLPMVLGGIVGGAMLSLSLRGTGRRLLGVLAYAVIGGGAIVAVLDPWLGILTGDLFPLWGAISLSLAATASVIVGLHSLIGAAGVAVGAILTMLVGNPISGTQAPSSFLPGAWGEIGQAFVPGASTTLLRSLAFFPDAATAPQWIVLSAWAAAGLLLIAVGHHRTGSRAARAELD